MISNWYGGLLFLAGFTLTATTILISQVSEPVSLSAQLILLFFGILFQLTLSVTAFLNLSIGILCKNLPKHTPRESILFPMVFLVNIMSQFGVALLFLYRNLTYLALVSVVVTVLLIIIGQLYQKLFVERMHSLRGKTGTHGRTRG